MTTSLRSVIDQMIKIHGWTERYANEVAIEYNKFMELRSKNEELSPSDPVDQFWHQHILNTKLYILYCRGRFGKFIHHNPNDAFDQDKRAKRLENTMTTYKDYYNNQPVSNVWYNRANDLTNKLLYHKDKVIPSVWTYKDPVDRLVKNNSGLKIVLHTVELHDIHDPKTHHYTMTKQTNERIVKDTKRTFTINGLYPNQDLGDVVQMISDEMSHPSYAIYISYKSFEDCWPRKISYASSNEKVKKECLGNFVNNQNICNVYAVLDFCHHFC